MPPVDIPDSLVLKDNTGYYFRLLNKWVTIYNDQQLNYFYAFAFTFGPW